MGHMELNGCQSTNFKVMAANEPFLLTSGNLQTPMPCNILLVEDESAIAEIVVYNLRKEGYTVTWEEDGIKGLLKAQSMSPDLCILDVMLPGLDGLQICRVLKSEPRTRSIPVLLLTAKSQETDEIRGFNMGADDYVAKPFRIQPLIHRIKALLRRAKQTEESCNVLALHGIEMDRRNHLMTALGVPIDLTPTEFRMVWTLMSQPGRAFFRSELLEGARGDDVYTLERTIDVHIRSVRKKLGEHEHLIETVRGIGYRFHRK